VDVTYVWPYKTDRAVNGLYTVDVKFMNDQRTATAQGIAQFEIGKGTVIAAAACRSRPRASTTMRLAGAAGRPGLQEEGARLELVPMLGVVAVALALARRRRFD